METRYVRAEMDVLRRFAAFLSELLFVRDDLNKKLDIVQDGHQRLEQLIQDSGNLVKDLLELTSENQRSQFRNSLGDYKIELVPKLTPNSTNILMTKEQVKALVDLAQEKCKSCVESPEDAKKCPVYRILETTALPDKFDSMLCPYSIAEWAD